MLLRNNIPVSYIFGKIRYEIIGVTIYAIAIAILYKNYNYTWISIPIALPAILGTVISLLLAFKSNQAYDRWWEARVLWGSIVNDSRTLTRQLLMFTNGKIDPPAERAFCERVSIRQIGWCYALSAHLRKEPPTERAAEFIPGEELILLNDSSNVPMALLDRQANDIREAYMSGWITDFQFVELDNTLTRFSNHLGGCERIKNTVFPATYSVYIHFAMLLFILLLPFGVIEFFGIVEVPLVIAIACSFFLIEKMAIHLQDPFENRPTDTPTTAISQTIELNILELLKDKAALQKRRDATRPVKDYYIL